MASVDKAAAKKQRIQPPNKDEFQRKLADLEKDLKEKEKECEVARNNVKALQSGGANGGSDEHKQLQQELDGLKKKQSELKASRGKVLDEIKIIDARLKKQIKDLQAAKAKSNFKSVDEIDAQIKKLERAVDSGTLRLVEEKRFINDISNLKKVKNSFGTFGNAQAAIDADRAKISELKASIDNDEAKATSARFEEVIAKLNGLRETQQAAYKNRNTLYDKRTEAETARNAVRTQIKELKDEHFGQVRAFRDQQQTERNARIEREKAEKVAYEKEKKKQDAQEKLDLAAEPAYASEISTAENLLAHFDPEYKRTGTVNGATSEEYAAKATRTVEAVPTNARIIKKETPDFFAGAASKGKKKGGKAASATSGSDKFSMNVSIIEDLSALNIGLPSGRDDIPATIESLKKKIAYFKENEARVTKERVEKAKAELAKLDAEEKKAAETEASTEVASEA